MNNIDYPRVLIISHNLYDDSNNIGKTLVSLFKGWPTECLAQIYFRNDKPSFKYCKRYYCITDKDVVESIYTFGKKKAGAVVNTNSSMFLTSVEANFYQVGNHRRPIISLIRDMMWDCGVWKSYSLEKWLKNDVKPDIILFAPNDYWLAYKIAIYVQKIVEKPIIPFYMDDSFYLKVNNHGIDAFRRKRILKLALEVQKHSNKIFTICKYMSDEYAKEFSIRCIDFVNSVEIENVEPKINKSNSLVFSYLGNLHSNRWKALCDIGKTIDDINYERHLKCELKIYSSSVLEKNIEQEFSKIKCLKFEGKVSAEEVRYKQCKSDVLIHVEAFDAKSIGSTRLSLSTKIPEYLSTGVCILAYGPSEIASIRYLHDNDLAEVCCDYMSLKKSITRILTDTEVRLKFEKRGLAWAQKYHDINKVSKEFQKCIMESV